VSPLHQISLSLCAPQPGGPRCLHGPMYQPPIFPLSHSPPRGARLSAPHGFSPISLSLCTTARWTPVPSRSHVLATRFSSLSLTSAWGPAVSPSRLFPNLSPCASSVPATSCRHRFQPPHHDRNLRTGCLRPSHPSLAAGLPLELVAHRRHVRAAYASGRCDRQLCHTAAMPGARRYAPTHATWATCRLSHLGIVGLLLPVPSTCT
jgi:hypothetical protein